MPSCLANAGPLEVVIEFYDKTDIFIHHFGQFLSPNSRSRVDVDKGKFIKIAIAHEVYYLGTFSIYICITHCPVYFHLMSLTIKWVPVHVVSIFTWMAFVNSTLAIISLINHNKKWVKATYENSFCMLVFDFNFVMHVIFSNYS